MKLKLLDDTFAIHRFGPFAKIPEEVFRETVFNITKTEEELSIVCRTSLNLNSEYSNHGWSCFKASGPMQLDATGFLAKLSRVMADAQISIFAMSTYDTDYILVKADKTAEAVAALKDAGIGFI